MLILSYSNVFVKKIVPFLELSNFNHHHERNKEKLTLIM